MTSYEDLRSAELAKLNEGFATRHLSVKLGEHFLATKTDTNELVTSWAHCGVEPISKKDFRQQVRDLLDTRSTKTNPVEVDALFDQLDEEGSGDLDVRELKRQFTMFQSAAVRAVDERANARTNADRYWQRADAAQRTMEVTVAYEKERDAIDRPNLSLRERLGIKLARKGVRANELVPKYGDAMGNLSKRDFFNMLVAILGQYDVREEDAGALFTTLSEGCGDTLDGKQVRLALQAMIAAGHKAVELNEQLEEALLVKLDVVYAAQSKLRGMLDEDKAMGVDVVPVT